MQSVTLYGLERESMVKLHLVNAANPTSDWCLGVKITSSDFFGRNNKVYFLEEDTVRFLSQLRAMEASRNGRAELRSVGEGSDAQEFKFALIARGPASSLIAVAEIVKLNYLDDGLHFDKCSHSFSIPHEHLLQIVRDLNELFRSNGN